MQPDPAAHLVWGVALLLFALVAAMFAYGWLADLVAWLRELHRRRGEATEATDAASRKPLTEPESPLKRRHLRQIRPVRRTWVEPRVNPPADDPRRGEGTERLRGS